MSKYGVFSGSYFPVFGLNYKDLRSKSPYSVQIQENTNQIKTPYLDTFHAVTKLSTGGSFKNHLVIEMLLFSLYTNTLSCA